MNNIKNKSLLVKRVFCFVFFFVILFVLILRSETKPYNYDHTAKSRHTFIWPLQLAWLIKPMQ